MDDKFLAACVQMNSGDVVADNLHRAADLISLAAAAGAAIVALPEFFPLMSKDEDAKLAVADDAKDGKIQTFLRDIAKACGVYLLGGTIPIVADDATSQTAKKVFSACLFISPDGEVLARYDKMHLFRYFGESQQFDETQTVKGGESVVAVDCGLGRIGLSVCYDLRFPELFRKMNCPDIICAPSAFTVETGLAHWQILLQARAIENLAFVLAPAQTGTHPGGRATFGHSAIIGAWGEILAMASGKTDEVIIAEIDKTLQQEMRRRLPALDNRMLR